MASPAVYGSAHPDEGSPDPVAATGISRRFPFFAVNLGAILALGVAVSAWFLRYTEFFPQIGGVLTLGGIFSWLAFVSRVISDDRQEQFQAWIDRRVLGRGMTTAFLGVVAAALAVAASFRGTIVIESLSGASQRAAWVHRPGEERGEADHIPAGGSLNVNVMTSPLSRSPYMVKVAGYPDHEVSVGAWERARVYVPVDLQRRPVLYLRPEPGLVLQALSEPMDLHVEIRRPGGETRHVKVPFDGHAYFVGSDADVDVPEGIRTSWSDMLRAKQHPALLPYWTQQAALETGLHPPLQAGDEIAFGIVHRGNGNAMAPEKVVKIAPVARDGLFLQQEAIDELE